jgi:hypothetical protein
VTRRGADIADEDCRVSVDEFLRVHLPVGELLEQRPESSDEPLRAARHACPRRIGQGAPLQVGREPGKGRLEVVMVERLGGLQVAALEDIEGRGLATH